MDRQAVFEYVKQQYDTEPDYPWMDNNAVLRHKENNKWYAVILEVNEDKLGLTGAKKVDVINVKCEPVLIGSLRQKKGYFPAYHMNKNSWISILLDDSVAEAEVTNLINFSFQLTQPKKSKKEKKMANKGVNTDVIL